MRTGLLTLLTTVVLSYAIVTTTQTVSSAVTSAEATMRNALNPLTLLNTCASDGEAKASLSWAWRHADKRPSSALHGAGVPLSVWGVNVIGGLTPSASIAAQAGAIDPAVAAMASAGGHADVGTAVPFQMRTQLQRSPDGACW